MSQSTLRGRLFLSYLLVLLVTLAVISGALLLIFNTRTAPIEPTLERLATFAVNINLRDLLRESNFRLFRPNEADFADLSRVLDGVATEYEVRMLLVSMGDRAVLYDSAAIYARGTILSGEVQAYRVPAAITNRLYAQVDAIGGSFTDPADGQEWLFVGIEGFKREGAAPGMGSGDRAPIRESTHALIYADLRPQQTLQDALTDFGAELFPLLAQGALVGIVIAVIVAGLIARSIARPLQTLAAAAGEMAQGYYGHQVAVSGPREVRALAESFNAMSGEVKATQQAQKDFMANVSHDLKTPLTSIQGFSGAIIDGTAPNPVKAAQIIHQEAERLNRMVTELTDLARLQAGQLSMHMTPLDLARLTESVAQRLSVIAHEKNITLTVDPHSAPIPINGDGDRLVQVVTNLIGNAIKYTPSGGHVWVGARDAGGGAALTVRDDGQGIAPAELDRIFERFYQVDKTRGPQRGTGLGLAIVREIVTAHGGQIEVRSEGEGRGSTFTIWLPSPGMSTVVRRRAS
ncbi:MAG: HAMP domain-containing sensor histidine kinase [Chloroflexota bacterium]|nr:HAMP domain-containing sensor histidine kinase [Chloroflexota bacterium]